MKNNKNTFKITYTCLSTDCTCVTTKEDTNNIYGNATIKCPFCGHTMFITEIKNQKELKKYYMEMKEQNK